MPISVVIPTHRQRFLEETLKGLVQQRDPDFDVVVVENGERDRQTRELCERFASQLAIKYVYLRQPGLNRARNLGVRESKGEVIALLDDDCLPDTDWVENLQKTHQGTDAWVIAGRVRLRFLKSPPAWITGHFRRQLSELDPELGEREPPARSVGANLSFKRERYHKLGEFDEDVGMTGRQPPQLCNDEKHFCQSAAERNRLIYEPSIAVQHIIPPDRMTMEYFEARAFGQGVSDASISADCVAFASERSLLRHFRLQEKFVHGIREGDSLGEQDRIAHRNHLIQCRLAYAAGLFEAYFGSVNTTQDNTRERAAAYRMGMESAERVGFKNFDRLCEVIENLYEEIQKFSAPPSSFLAYLMGMLNSGLGRPSVLVAGCEVEWLRVCE